MRDRRLAAASRPSTELDGCSSDCSTGKTRASEARSRGVKSLGEEESANQDIDPCGLKAHG